MKSVSMGLQGYRRRCETAHRPRCNCWNSVQATRPTSRLPSALLTLKDDTKRALSNLLADLVVYADNVARAGGMAAAGQVSAWVGRNDMCCGHGGTWRECSWCCKRDKEREEEAKREAEYESECKTSGLIVGQVCWSVMRRGCGGGGLSGERGFNWRWNEPRRGGWMGGCRRGWGGEEERRAGKESRRVRRRRERRSGLRWRRWRWWFWLQKLAGWVVLAGWLAAGAGTGGTALEGQWSIVGSNPGIKYQGQTIRIFHPLTLFQF